ncbi:hypothetical protein AB0395_47165, partial [Streptosporangium sp. NPDC051023]|uniref:hypothetical protein n=1 Tax=Streptosporangium sp. NPDC051023 TaxID=3155410 RepID=UPI00344F578A
LALPAATRPRLDTDVREPGTPFRHREALLPRFLGPHAAGSALAGLEVAYRSARDRIAAVLI